MAHRTSRFKRIIVIASAVALGLGGAGVAFAYWTSSGTGDGKATTGRTTADFTIAADTAVGTIVPDGPGQTIDFHVTNPADTPQHLTNVAVTFADSGGAWVPTGVCDVTQYHAAVAIVYGDIAGAATLDGVVTVTLTNTPTVNQDDCQRQTVPLHFVAS